MSSDTRGRLHVEERLHTIVAEAATRLFSRLHSGRYFGGFWFKVFCERGPC